MTERPRPNFLIVGAPKAGTTSLYHWLRQHPQVFLPAEKEPHYFMRGYGRTDRETYLDLFAAAAHHRAVGEASVSYLFHAESPAWIARELGDVRIVILLRHPLERLRSVYFHNVAWGAEWLPLGAALEAEATRLSDPLFRADCERRRLHPEFFAYFRSSLYADQVARYAHAFSRVKVVAFDALVRAPADTYRDVCRFLSIDDAFAPAFTAENRGRRPFAPRLQWQLIRAQPNVSGANVSLRHRVLYHLWAWGPRLNARVGARFGRADRLAPAVRQRLTAAYHADLERLRAIAPDEIPAWL